MYLAVAGMLGGLQWQATTAYSQGASYKIAFLCLYNIEIICFSFNTPTVRHNKNRTWKLTHLAAVGMLGVLKRLFTCQSYVFYSIHQMFAIINKNMKIIAPGCVGKLGVLKRRATTAYSQSVPYRKKGNCMLCLYHMVIIIIMYLIQYTKCSP